MGTKFSVHMDKHNFCSALKNSFERDLKRSPNQPPYPKVTYSFFVSCEVSSTFS